MAGHPDLLAQLAQGGVVEPSSSPRGRRRGAASRGRSEADEDDLAGRASARCAWAPERASPRASGAAVARRFAAVASGRSSEVGEAADGGHSVAGPTKARAGSQFAGALVRLPARGTSR